MRLVKKFFIIILLFLMGVGIIYGMIKYEKKDRKYEVVKWDNLYEESNIKMFYTLEDKRLEILDSTYGINEKISSVDEELNKVLRVVDIINSIVEYDDVEEKQYFNAYDILRNSRDGKKVSGRDMAIIYRDFLSASGIVARVGQYKNVNKYWGKESVYYVVEYWSNENNKWVMIDFIDKGYFLNLGIPMSAIEISSNDYKNVEYVGKKSKKEYLKAKKNVFETYTIAIDNTLDMKKSNSFITFISNKEDITIEHNNNLIPPTIFTNKISLFNIQPNGDVDKKDSKINIILMKKDGENESIIIGGFHNSTIADKYYIRINGNDYYSVSKYTETELINGSTKIEISLDGVNTLAEVEIKRN